MDLRRTDLAMEARELWQERAGQAAELPGVQAEERERAGMPVTVVRVLDKAGERALGKPRGTYITLTLEGVETRADGAFPRAVEAVAAELGELLEQIDLKKGPVLVAGLGNRAITPDAIGPRVHDCTLVTRHLVGRMPEQFGHLRPVASVAAEVMDQYRAATGDRTPTVFVSTASPYKFCGAVLTAIGETPRGDGVELLDQLHEVSGVAVPRRLAALKGKARRFDKTVEKQAMEQAVLEFLQ